MQRKSVALFLLICLLSGAGILAGSVLGTRWQNGLFAGAILGGLLGILLAAGLAIPLNLIERKNYLAVSIGGLAGFVPASAIALANLHTPLIPLASVTLIGCGALVGNSYLPRVRGLKSDAVLAGSGLLLSAPALLFVAASLLKYGLDIDQPFNLLDGVLADPERFRAFNLISPIVFLGGLLAAVLLNLYPQIDLHVQRTNKKLVATISAEAKPVNLAIVALCCLVGATLVGYVALENLARL
jgi:hypothetical protein